MIEDSKKESYELFSGRNGAFYVANELKVDRQLLVRFGYMFNSLAIHQLIGLKLYSIDKQCLAARLASQSHLKGFSSMHGGVIATCLDSVGAFRTMQIIARRHANTRSENQENDVEESKKLFKKILSVRTLNLDIEYKNPADFPVLEVQATHCQEDEKFSTCNLKMLGPDDSVLAEGTGTYFCKP